MDFCIKFSIEGNVPDQCGYNKILLEPGQVFLTSCQQATNEQIVQGDQYRYVCIDISQSTFAEAFSLLDNEQLPKGYTSQYFTFPNFYEHVYDSNSPYSQKIEVLKKDLLAKKKISSIDHTWFVDLAKDIIIHESEYFERLNKLNSSKRITTRKEILSRLLIAKHFMEENYLQNPSISEVAIHCNLSIYYFFRSFRQVFGVTPYHYMLEKRLDHASSLLGMNKFSLTEIAFRCGFTDMFSFSKAFKKQYEYSPSRYAAIIAA